MEAHWLEMWWMIGLICCSLLLGEMWFLIKQICDVSQVGDMVAHLLKMWCLIDSRFGSSMVYIVAPVAGDVEAPCM